MNAGGIEVAVVVLFSEKIDENDDGNKVAMVMRQKKSRRKKLCRKIMTEEK